ncbi:MAG: glucose 1-dehydrogenase [Chloroflexota bacterium]
MDLKGKTAVITGGGRGIGRAIALALAEYGCNVVVNFFRQRTQAEETARRIGALGVQALAVRAHMGQEGEAERLVHEAAKLTGSVDIFVGNAASGVQRSILDIDTKAWDWTLNINARSILQGVQAAVPLMTQQGWGRVLTITSAGSRRTFPDYGIVGTSKAAIEALTRYLAVELAPHNIIANCISPGIVLTDALKSFPRQQQMVEQAQANTPAERLVTPEDVGNLAAWLCTDQASMIVGQTIEIDGGYGLTI